MKRVTLFSALTESNRDVILTQIFPSEINDKILAYMPSNGVEGAQEYIEEWEGYAKRFDAKFLLIDNSTYDPKEQQKLLDANILLITGGNTFTLLDNLRKSKLDTSIREFIKKPEYVLAGFSAGALVLTPTIEACNLPNYDENLVGVKDLTGLDIVDFEVLPHYEENSQKDMLRNYRQSSKYQVREITDEDFIILSL